MAETKRDSIITSETADRMLERVSPIYDDSEVGLWMFEAIGQEYDDLWELVKTLPDQLFPETVTWAIELWEQRYGIATNEGLTLEQRRTALIAATGTRGAMNPAKLASMVTQATGVACTVTENVDDYTFRVTFDWLLSDPSVATKLIKKVKPAHLSYTIEYELNGAGSVSSVAMIGMGGKVALTQAT